VAADPESRLRHVRVLPIRVSPLTYDPNTGDAVLATSIRIEVALSPSGSPRPGLRPLVEPGLWERIYSRTLVNPGQARQWRSKPRSGMDASRLSTMSQSFATVAGPLVKLAVFANGMHRVTASNVIAKGFPTDTPTDQLHLFKRHYNGSTLTEDITDIGFKVIEDAGGTAGVFDGSDYLVFYGNRLMDDALQGDAVEKFSFYNAYWLGTTAGAQINQKAVPAGTVTGDTATATFAVSAYFEEDLFFVEETPPLIRDFYYYNSQLHRDLIAPFTLGPVDGSSTFRLTAKIMGGDPFRADRDIMLEIVNANGTTALPTARVPRKEVVNYDSGLLPASALVAGLNRLQFSFVNRSVLEVVLNHFTVEYDSPFRASGNVIEFNAGALSGANDITVVGLNRKDVMLFDVTDPYAVEECILNDNHFTDVGGGGFAMSFGGSFTGSERFILAPLDRITEIAAANVHSDEPSTLIGHPLETGVDVLVVSHAGFMDEMQRWVDYRKAQGQRVLMADVVDVFDEFNGGVPNANAIRRMAEHFFTTGGAGALVLVGDASEDSKQVHSDSPPDFVPTESFTEHVSSSVFNEDEVVTTDKWTVMFNADVIYGNASLPADFFPSMIVGRFPAGNVAELRRMIDKTFGFEAPAADDFWRRRMIRVADDQWSGGNFICDRNEPFEVAEELAAVTTEQSLAGGYEVVRFFLQDRISHPNVSCPGVSVFSQCQVTRADATPVFLDELSRGATMVSINAHMNRFQICHEWLFTSSDVFTGPNRDYLNINNYGKPFILFGMGCHLSDYALHRELTQSNQRNNGPDGDCISELMLQLEDRGAVCTYASSGFEYLNENIKYTDIIAQVFFKRPPTTASGLDGRDQARWIMGEVMTAAEIENLLRWPIGAGLGARGQAKRYHILGDPLLRIDAGPPRFLVTVDGDTVQTGDPLFSSSGGDSVTVRAIISDEVAIEKLTVEIDGQDVTNQATITPLVDQALDASRQYEVTFKHKILPDLYDIVIRAHQAADTTGTGYHMTAEFTLSVELDIELRVDGRPVVGGDIVPANGNYVFELKFPIEVDAGLIRAEVDGSAVTNLNLAHPSPSETTTWLASFSSNLPPGPHDVSIFVDTSEFAFSIVVGSQIGLHDLMVYPNPFVDDTYFVFSTDMEITDGTIDVFTTSGKRIARLDIPSESRAVGQNAVHWNGRTSAGNTIANGTYLYVVNVSQAGGASTHRGKLVRVK
jgi:hypothetical protein